MHVISCAEKGQGWGQRGCSVFVASVESLPFNIYNCIDGSCTGKLILSIFAEQRMIHKENCRTELSKSLPKCAFRSLMQRIGQSDLQKGYNNK